MNLSIKCVLKVMFIFKFVSFTLSYSDYSFDQISHEIHPNTENELCQLDSISAPKPGWIDPFDMLGESRSRDSLFVQSDVEIHTLTKRCNNYEIYLKRFVNLFLHAVDLRDVSVLDDSVNLIKLEFLIDGRDINTLKDFGQKGNNGQKIEFVSDVFTKIFSQKISQDRNGFMFSNLISWFQEGLLKVLSSPEWTVLSSVVLLMFLTLWSVYKTHNYRLALFTMFLAIFLAGFGFNWIRMYEEKEIERYVNIDMHGSIPRHCSSQSHSMAWYEHMFYRMFGVDCQEYYKSRDVRPLVKISPTDVLAETFSSMIINPAKNIGTAYGNFVSSSIDPLPFWLQPIALPLSFILPVLIVVILLPFLFNYKLSLSITGFYLTPTLGHASHHGVRKDSQYVEDCPRKESSQQSSDFNTLLDRNTPLFVMNWMALKKISSSSLLLDKNEEKQEKKSVNKEEPSLKDENEMMAEEFKQFEKFVESLEDQKCAEERKKERSLDTYAEGERSLARKGSDHQKSPKVEHIRLPSDDINKEKSLKDKTT